MMEQAKRVEVGDLRYRSSGRLLPAIVRRIRLLDAQTRELAPLAVQIPELDAETLDGVTHRELGRQLDAAYKRYREALRIARGAMLMPGVL